MLELALNLVWAAAALSLVALWLRAPASQRFSRCTQVLALFAVLLLLLPVISMSDDLAAMQLPAEAANCLRRVSDSDQTHLLPRIATALPTPSFRFRALYRAVEPLAQCLLIFPANSPTPLPVSRPPPASA